MIVRLLVPTSILVLSRINGIVGDSSQNSLDYGQFNAVFTTSEHPHTAVKYVKVAGEDGGFQFQQVLSDDQLESVPVYNEPPQPSIDSVQYVQPEQPQSLQYVQPDPQQSVQYVQPQPQPSVQYVQPDVQQPVVEYVQPQVQQTQPLVQPQNTLVGLQQQPTYSDAQARVVHQAAVGQPPIQPQPQQQQYTVPQQPAQPENLVHEYVPPPPPPQQYNNVGSTPVQAAPLYTPQQPGYETVHYHIERQDGSVVDYYQDEPKQTKAIEGRFTRLFSNIKSSVFSLLPASVARNSDSGLGHLFQRFLDFFLISPQSRSGREPMEFEPSAVVLGLSSIIIGGILALPPLQ